ncbi:MAG: hypothetical protein M0P76_05505 [Candidatus Pacebacteria bacterium]|jgi:hypothetical protein|nr:hypothetical protein [Candidatus Paceibacterota bacterium]
MPGQNFEQAPDDSDQPGHSQEEIFPDVMVNLIKIQWIPDTEELLPKVFDPDLKNGFGMELAKIKTDFETIEHADWNDNEVKKQVKDVYMRAEDLYGKVGLCVEEKEAA